jgi:hypothetical protein
MITNERIIGVDDIFSLFFSLCLFGILNRKGVKVKLMLG